MKDIYIYIYYLNLVLSYREMKEVNYAHALLLYIYIYIDRVYESVCIFSREGKRACECVYVYFLTRERESK